MFPPIDGAVPPDGSLTTAKLADPAGMPTVRRAAGFSGAANVVATFLWAPTGQAFSFRAKVRIYSATNPAIFGRQVAGYYSFGVKSDGAFELRANNTIVATSTAGLVPVDGTAVALGADITPTSVNWLVGGAVVQTQTHAGGALSTSAGTQYLGGRSPASLGLQCDLWDLELIDPASTANSAFFALDGDFVNTAAGSSVADATPSGFISWPTVLSTGGSERAVLAKESYLHFSRLAGNYSVNGALGTTGALTTDTIVLNESGGMTTGGTLFTAPVPGVADVKMDTTVLANADPADLVDFVYRVNGLTTLVSSITELGDVKHATSLSVSGVVSMAAGDVLSLTTFGILATTTATLVSPRFTLRFHPTA